MIVFWPPARYSALAVLFLGLQACGGGGGGDTAAPVSPVVAASTATAVLISGVATFDSVPNKTSAAPFGSLVYATTTTKPIRGVTIQVISAADGTTVLASTTSSEQGSYAMSVPSNTQFFLRMRAELVNTSGTSTWNVAVKDNTQGDALYVLDGAALPSGTANRVVDITAASGWNGSCYGAMRGGGIAAILDTIYSGMKVVSTAQPASVFPALNVMWSPLNTTVAGNLAAGEIGTSFFASNTAGARFIYLLGKEGIDTDEYDSAVVAHEYGHYLQSAFSTSHSLGGSHGYPDKLDMTVAFSEGWGNAWAGISRNDPYYSDSFGLSQGSGFAFRLDIPATDTGRGWYREDSIDASLYMLSTQQGFAPIWAALTGPMKTTQHALASIFSFADAVRTAGNAGVTTAMNTLLTAQSIFTGTGASQWGTNEINNGGELANLPVYTTLAYGASTPVCFSASNVSADGTANKLGSTRYFRINLTAAQAGTRTVTANFGNGRDVDFEVFQNRTRLVNAASVATSALTETATVALQAGEVIIRALDWVTTTPPTGAACATIKIS